MRKSRTKITITLYGTLSKKELEKLLCDIDAQLSEDENGQAWADYYTIKTTQKETIE